MELFSNCEGYITIDTVKLSCLLNTTHKVLSKLNTSRTVLKKYAIPNALWVLTQ